MKYIQPSFEIIEFISDDIITSSAVVATMYDEVEENEFDTLIINH